MSDCPDPDTLPIWQGERKGPRPPAPIMPETLPGVAMQKDGDWLWAVFDAEGYELRRYATKAEANAFLDGLTYSPTTG